jgi:hypothetical protein
MRVKRYVKNEGITPEVLENKESGLRLFGITPEV